MKSIIKPNLFAKLILPSCGAYQLELTNTLLKYSFNGQSTDLDYQDISSTNHHKGFIWDQLLVSFISGEELKLSGLRSKKVANLNQAIKEKITEVTRIRESFSAHEAIASEVSDWIITAKKGGFWISEQDLEEILQKANSLKYYFHIDAGYFRGHESFKFSINSAIKLITEEREFKDGINQIFVPNELKKFKDFFNGVEKYPLTEEQREAAVTNENCTLVIASAGSGKTSLLVGKVAYLLEKQLALPHEILLLAFNKKAKEEIENRLESKFKISFNTYTFHSFGLDVIGRAGNQRPSLAEFVEHDSVYQEFIQKIVGNIFSDPHCLNGIREFFISFQQPYKDKFDFKNLGEYYKSLKSSNLVTLNGERVKSFEELEIANFLFANGIEYEYEKPYPHNTATAQKRQYKPDFYLPADDLFIEHLALNENYKTPPFINEAEYLASIDWKDAIHLKFETKLIKTYSYEKRKGILSESLTDKLKTYGVEFNPLSQEALLEKLNSLGYVSEFAKLCGTFLNLFKGRGLSIKNLRELNFDNNAEQQRFNSFLNIFEIIFDRYQNELSNNKTIDFHDMINLASSLISSDDSLLPYKYILVDEFQDISSGRSALIKSLQLSKFKPKLFCVGDDWQSIYRFAGSDISLMTHFQDNFGFTKTLNLSETFRFNDRIESVASKFIQKNSSQLKKTVVTRKKSNRPEVVLFMPNENTGGFLNIFAKEINAEATAETSVLILGRYNYIGEGIQYSQLKSIAPTCSFEFNSAHRSKGREADYVIVLGLNSGRYGFPTEITDDPLIDPLLSQRENFSHSEERRLFYVAITRARKRVYIVADPINTSPFFMELVRGDFDVEKRNVGHKFGRMCPLCETGHILEKSGRNGPFLGCEHYPYCNFTTNFCKSCGIGFLAKEVGLYKCDNENCGHTVQSCPRCGNGMLNEINGKNGLFLGCSNYAISQCTYTCNI